MNKALTNYYKILNNELKPKFKTNKDLLNEKIKTAFKILENCELCERKCHVNRVKGELGFCKVGLKWRIFGAHIHLGEEPQIIPSATLFLAGCTLRCCYCQNAPESITPELGEEWSDKEVAEWIDNKYNEGCKNVNFVTPDCYLWNILKALKLVKANIPVVWNSSSYYSEKTAEIIKNIVDVYLLDFRYFNNDCAIKLSSAPNYPNAAKRNLLLAKKYGELLIRVLVLPNHIECCTKPILKWVANNLGDKAIVNVMSQYRPVFNADKHPEINRALTSKEFEQAVNYAEKLKLNFIT